LESPDDPAAQSHPPRLRPPCRDQFRPRGAAAARGGGGGGCSGFQYEIDFGTAAADDLVLESDGQQVLIDPVSLPFLAGASIDYSEELIGARFVIDNPNATASCGCGTSFSV